MVTPMKKMTETIHYMVTSSKNKEENTICMMSSVTETIFQLTVEIAVTVSAEMTAITVTVSTEEILETMLDMAVTSEEELRYYPVKQ